MVGSALGSTRSSSCLAAELHSKFCCLVDGFVLAVAVRDCWVWALVLGSCSVVKLLGGRGAFVLVSSGWWHCLAVAVVIACCGLWCWARARSSSCLAAEVHSIWCRLVGGIVFAVAVISNCWDLGSGRGLNLVVRLFGDWCTIGLVDESSIIVGLTA